MGTSLVVIKFHPTKNPGACWSPLYLQGECFRMVWVWCPDWISDLVPLEALRVLFPAGFCYQSTLFGSCHQRQPGLLCGWCAPKRTNNL